MPQFRNWSNLTVLSLFGNSDLDFDLGILDNMTELQHVLVQVCSCPPSDEEAGT